MQKGGVPRVSRWMSHHWRSKASLRGALKSRSDQEWRKTVSNNCLQKNICLQKCVGCALSICSRPGSPWVAAKDGWELGSDRDYWSNSWGCEWCRHELDSRSCRGSLLCPINCWRRCSCWVDDLWIFHCCYIEHISRGQRILFWGCCPKWGYIYEELGQVLRAQSLAHLGSRGSCMGWMRSW